MNDNVVPTAIHRITTLHAGAQRVHRALAECPRQSGSVDVAVCATCPHARGFVGVADDTTRSVLCSVERSERVRAEAGSVGGLMRRHVLCVRPDVDLDDVVLLFIERSIGGVPVVDDGDVPIGMISKTDLLASYAMRRRQGDARLDSFDGEQAQPAEEATAQDVMSPVVFTLRESESVARAAELFAGEHVHRAPVVGADGKVVGVLTSFDLVRSLAGAP